MKLEKIAPVSWSLKDIILIMLALVLAGMAYSRWGTVLIEKSWINLTAQPPNELLNSIIGAVLQGGLIILMVVLLVRVRYQDRLSSLGLSTGWSSRTRILSEGVVGGVLLLLAVSITAVLVFSFFSHSFRPQPFAELITKAKSWKQLVPLMLIGSVLAPFSEEMLFRGLLFGWLRQRLGVAAGIWVSGLIFAGMHLDLLRLFPLLLGGAGLAYIYQRTGSLYASILAHAVWNSAMTLLIWWVGVNVNL